MNDTTKLRGMADSLSPRTVMGSAQAGSLGDTMKSSLIAATVALSIMTLIGCPNDIDTQEVKDSTAPTLVTMGSDAPSIDGRRVTLTFTEDLAVSTVVDVRKAEFSISVDPDGNGPMTASPATISTLAAGTLPIRIELRLSEAVGSAAVLKLAYTRPSDRSGWITDVAGNPLANFEEDLVSEIPPPVSDASAMGGTTDGSIDLGWTNPMVDDLDYIEIRWEPFGIEHGHQPVSLTGTAGVSGSRTISLLTPGTVYTFTLTVIDTDGNRSANVEILASAANLDPGSVTGQTAQGGVNEGEIDVSWTNPTSSAFVRVEIDWQPADASLQTPTIDNNPGADNSVTLTDLTPGNIYTIGLTAIGSTGRRIPAEVSATATDLAPTTVSDPGATTGLNEGEVDLSWTNPDDADLDRIEIGWEPAGVGHGTQPVTVQSDDDPNDRATIMTLTPGTTYTFTLTAIDAGDNRSDGVAIMHRVPETPPNNISEPMAMAGSGNGEVDLSWTNPADSRFASVQISWTPMGAGNGNQPVTVPGTTESPGSRTITNLFPGREYSFILIALDSGSATISSRPATASAIATDLTPPGEVSELRIVQNSGMSETIELFWTNPTDADFDRIEIVWTPEGTGHGSQPVTVYSDDDPNDQVIISQLTPSTLYTFTLTTVDTRDNRSNGLMFPITTLAPDADGDGVLNTRDRDADGDGLIEIDTLDMLNNIRNKLDGTAYNDGNSDDDTGCGGMTGVTTCSGYELTRDLDFDDGDSYASGSINSAWRPNNADLSSATNPGWVPIGVDYSKRFKATFDGNGHSVGNLYTLVSSSNIANVGLFGYLGSEATVRNIGVTEVFVSATDIDIAAFSGGLAGLNRGSIVNAWATGSVFAYAGNSANDNAVSGGLVGYNTGSITNGRSTASVFASSTLAFAGGLVGGNYEGGSIINAWATSSTVAFGYRAWAGGLVGSNTGSSITNAYATGSIAAASSFYAWAGGLVGVATGSSITNIYATGSISTTANRTAYAGGLAGLNDNDVTNAWSTGSISAAGVVAFPGGFMGYHVVGGDLSRAYWDKDTTSQRKNFGGTVSYPTTIGTSTTDYREISAIVDLTSAQMRATSGTHPQLGSAFDLGTSSEYPLLRYGGTMGTDCRASGASGSLPVCGTLLPGQAVRMASGFLRFSNTEIGEAIGSEVHFSHKILRGSTSIEISGIGVNGTTAGSYSIENESGTALSSPTVSGTTITVGGFTGEFYLKATFTKGSESFTRRYRFKRSE